MLLIVLFCLMTTPLLFVEPQMLDLWAGSKVTYSPKILSVSLWMQPTINHSECSVHVLTSRPGLLRSPSSTRGPRDRSPAPLLWPPPAPPATLPPFLLLQRTHWSPEDTDTHFKGSSASVCPCSSSSSSRGHTVKLGRMPGQIELRGSLMCIVGRARYLAYLHSADKIRLVCVCLWFG